MKNQSLQELISALPEQLKQDILQETDVSKLNTLKTKHKKNQNTIAVINARIENLTYLAI